MPIGVIGGSPDPRPPRAAPDIRPNRPQAVNEAAAVFELTKEMKQAMIRTPAPDESGSRHRLPLRQAATFASVSIGVAILAASCFGPTPSSTPTSANVNLDYAFSSLGAPQCTATIRWDIRPVSLTGNDGSSNEITNTQSYTVQPDATGSCHIGYGALGLKFGTWRFSVQTAQVHTCELAVTATTEVYFAEGQELCSHVP